MGKKPSNRNKRKKNGNKILQNPCEEQKAKSVSDRVIKKEKNIDKNHSYLGAYKEPLDPKLPNHDLSFKVVSNVLKSNPSVSLIENNRENSSEKFKSSKTEGIKMQSHGGTLQNSYGTNIYPVSPGAKHNKVSEEICNASVKESKKKNFNSPLTDMDEVKPETLSPYEMPEPSLKDEFPVRLLHEYSCLSESDKESYISAKKSVESKRIKPKPDFQNEKLNSLFSHLSESDEEYPMSYVSVKKSVEVRRMKPKSDFQNKKLNSLPKEFSDKLNLCTYPIEEGLRSDEAYSTSDFFQPVFDDYELKNKIFLDSLEENVDGIENENSYCEGNVWSSEASYSKFRNSREKSGFEGAILKTFSNSLDAYKNSQDSFKDLYHNWLPERRNTLQKLKALYTEVHNDQLNYNKSRAAFRELGLASRVVKSEVENLAVNFLASFTSFLSDAASGAVSVAQAFNVDSYQNKFQEIMEHDAEITQRLYKARSRCVGKYQDIEEVMRKFHSDTFSSTVDKISNTLEVGKYWEAMKDAYGKDDMPQLRNVVSKFFDNAFQSTKLEEVSDSIQGYVHDNPAALDACKSAGRATYGALDTWVLSHNQSSLVKGVRCSANHMLMIQDVNDLDHLKSSIEIENSPQSTLESQIEDAIDSLESEMKEINDIYFEQFKIQVDSDCDIYACY